MDYIKIYIYKIQNLVWHLLFPQWHPVGYLPQIPTTPTTTLPLPNMPLTLVPQVKVIWSLYKVNTSRLVMTGCMTTGTVFFLSRWWHNISLTLGASSVQVPILCVCLFGLVQNCGISIANALELLQCCTKPSIYETQTWSSLYLLVAVHPWAVLEIPTGPPVRGWQLWRRTENILLIFL